MTGYGALVKAKKQIAALTRYSFPTKYFLFFQPVLEPCEAGLKTNQPCCLARKHKVQLRHIVVNETAWLVHFCQQFHFLESRKHKRMSTQTTGEHFWHDKM
jgi:hypothetical protein